MPTVMTRFLSMSLHVALPLLGCTPSITDSLDSGPREQPSAVQPSPSPINSELAAIPLPSVAPSQEMRSDHTISRVTHCCRALRQNAWHAPLKMNQEYKAAAAICDKLVDQPLHENEKLARVREPLVNAPIPATCKDRDTHGR